MTKSLMISIRPEHAENILNGKKTLDLRTWIPKGYVGWVYVYVTNGKPYLVKFYNDYPIQAIKDYTYQELLDDGNVPMNGKVAFRFWFDEYEEYNDYSGCTNNENGFECENEYMYHLCELPNKIKELCLTCDEIETYGNGKTLYAWHIKQLEIFDTPKELSEFESRTPYKNKDRRIVAWGHRPIIRAPQKMQWVYVKELENEKE